MKNLIENLNHFYETWVWTSLELGYLDTKEKPVDWLDQAKRFWEYDDKLRSKHNG